MFTDEWVVNNFSHAMLSVKWIFKFHFIRNKLWHVIDIIIKILLLIFNHNSLKQQTLASRGFSNIQDHYYAICKRASTIKIVCKVVIPCVIARHGTSLLVLSLKLILPDKIDKSSMLEHARLFLTVQLSREPNPIANRTEK